MAHTVKALYYNRIESSNIFADEGLKQAYMQ